MSQAVLPAVPPRRHAWIEAFIPKSLVCLREGYGKQFLLSDILAGLTVGVIALPLGLAFAIASHCKPEKVIPIPWTSAKFHAGSKCMKLMGRFSSAWPIR
jgi:hypothetical protein